MSLLTSARIVVKDGSSQCPVAAPLELSLRYQVSQVVVKPRWTLTYVADVASENVESVLACSTSNDGRFVSTGGDVNQTLTPGMAYELHIIIPADVMRSAIVDRIALKYLLQIGTFTFALDSAEDADGSPPLHDVARVVCQVRPTADGALIRTILQD